MDVSGNSISVISAAERFLVKYYSKNNPSVLSAVLENSKSAKMDNCSANLDIGQILDFIEGRPEEYLKTSRTSTMEVSFETS